MENIILEKYSDPLLQGQVLSQKNKIKWQQSILLTTRKNTDRHVMKQQDGEKLTGMEEFVFSYSELHFFFFKFIL